MAEILIITVPADQTKPMELKSIPRDLDSMQELVGGLIEPMSLQIPAAATLWINEEGHMMDLPLNRRASLIVEIHSRIYTYGTYVVGDAFIAGPVDRNGNETDVPPIYLDIMGRWAAWTQHRR